MKFFDISPYSLELCNKYMNQDCADEIILKTEDNAYKVEIYQIIVTKLKNESINNL